MSLLRATWPALFRIAWPASVTGFMRVAMRTVDLVVVGAVIGATGVAAVGIADAAARVVVLVALGLASGTAATVAQRHGAGDRQGTDAAATQTALIAGLLGLVATIGGLAGADAFFALVGAEGTVAADGAAYLRIVLGVSVPKLLTVMLARVFQSVGDTRTPMLVRTVGTSVNIGLTVALVGGLGPFPALGVVGAALGSAVGDVLAGVTLTGILASGRYRAVGLSPAGITDFATGRRIVTVGAPQALERSLIALAAIPINALVLTFGTAANAGYNVGRRVLLLGIIPVRGVAIAASTLVGNHVGRRDVDVGRGYGQGALAMSATLGVAAGVLLASFARPVASLFASGEPAATAAIVPWVRTFAFALPFRSLFAVLRGAMQGSGETRYPLYASTVGALGVLLGGAWLLGQVAGLGLAAIYAAVIADPATRVAMLGRWWSNDSWQRSIRPARPDHLAAHAG